MSSEAQRKKVKAAIQRHHNWLSQWNEGRSAFTRTMVSPRGKSMGYHSYCVEVNKHMDRTIKRIESILFEESKSV